MNVLDRSKEEAERARDDAPRLGRALNRVSADRRKVSTETKSRSSPRRRRIRGGVRLAGIGHAVRKDEAVLAVEHALSPS